MKLVSIAANPKSADSSAYLCTMRKTFFIWLIFSSLSAYGQISDEMKRTIKQMENLSLEVYMDGLYRAVGYGHRLKDTDVSWVRELELYDEISAAAAEIIFDLDMVYLVGPGLTEVRKEIGWNYPPGVYDAMGSLIYNMGLSGLRETEFYLLFKNRRYEEAFKVLPHTKSGQPGLFDRRMKELDFLMRGFDFSTGRYRPVPMSGR